MHIPFAAALVFMSLQAPASAPAVSVPLDITRVQAGPITVVRGDNSVTVSWPDETKQVWRATFSLDPSQPLVTSIGPEGEPVVRGARPFYRGETGKRRGGWYAFFDDPASHPDGTRHVQSTFALRGAVARSIGERVEIEFDGLRMGTFDGGLAYTFYPGSRLVQQEAVMTTYEADVAYYYDAGLDMAAPSDRQPGGNMRTEIVHYDTEGALRRTTSNGLQAERAPVQARYRTLAVKTAGGSVAVFPAPHQYFFPRDFTSNLGFVWHHTHELYAHMNINYVKLDRLPSFDRWGDALAPLARGEFFTTTGEVLLPDVNLASSSDTEIVARTHVQWTFPLRFAEIVWGDGQTTHREVIELADTREFGGKTFEWRAPAKGWKWARVAVWDVAGNGAFVNPVWRP